MANPQPVRKVGAHSFQETRPCDSSSPRPTVAPDSQPPPTGRKRKHRTHSSEHQASQTDSLHHPEHKAKRHKSSTKSCSTSPSSTNSSWSNWDRAERNYWDTLSKVGITSGSVRELNRRNALLCANLPPTAHTPVNLKCPKDITHFARRGGPDLSDIRNYRNPEEVSSTPTTMPSRSSGRGKTSSAYNLACAQDLTDHYVSPPDIDHGPTNYQDWTEMLVQPRASLSPSRNSDASFKSFVRAVGKVQNEDQLMSNVWPGMVGKKRPPSGQNAKFGNITALTPQIVVAKPDYYEGCSPGPGNRNIRDRLDKAIVPSTRRELPFLPTFFAEAKGPDGSISVAERQLRHDGALGSRAMHSVQALGRRERYDNEAHTAGAILHGRGHLDMFTHHQTQPRGPGTPAHTRMTPLGSWSLTHSPQSLRQGLTALRNTSDKAHQHREHAIQDANRRLGIMTPEGSQMPRRSSRRLPSSRAKLAPRSTRRSLSCQSSVVESSDDDRSSSSEEGESDDGNYRKSSRANPKGKLSKPNLVVATPKRPATRSPSSGPMTRQRRAMVVSDSDPNSSSEEEPSRAHGRRQQPKPKVVTISPKGGSRRDSSPQRRVLRPRRGSRRP